MDLAVFHERIRGMVAEELASRYSLPDQEFPSEELLFAELVMQQLQNAGLCDSFQVCYWTGKVGPSKLKITGFALSSDETRLDLLVTLYDGGSELKSIKDSDIVDVARSALQFVKLSAEKRLLSRLDPSSEVYELVDLIERTWNDLDQVRVFVITDGQSRSKHFKGKEVEGKGVLVEAMDIERLCRHMSGTTREEIAVSFPDMLGRPLACVHVPDPAADYEFALAAIPGEVVYSLYERHNTRLLEANVRTFLGTRGKVNKGIALTLAGEPEHFMAYNNGLVIVCDEAQFVQDESGNTCISLLRGLQIVNGGQTTSSIYFAKRDKRDLDLSSVRVPAKIIVLRNTDEQQRDRLIADISQYANSQNAVKTSDLSANRPFHIQLEKLSQEQWRPDGVGRWYYERAAGSYSVMLLREGTTKAKRDSIQKQIPPKRRLTKNDVARYVEAWRRVPWQVSLGGEKNFVQFMTALDQEPELVPTPIDGAWYRALIGKAIIFLTVQDMIKTKSAKATFRQGYANISTYVLSIVSERLGDSIDFEEIWRRQELSSAFKDLLFAWAEVVNSVFTEQARGRQFSEVAKRPDLWAQVKGANYPGPLSGLPELKVSDIGGSAKIQTG